MSSVDQISSRTILIDTKTSKQVQNKILKGLLDLIVLKFLHAESMHGYMIIVQIRRTFGVYFGPSTIYPMLFALEHHGYIISSWDMTYGHPRKLYRLTSAGENLLQFSERTLEFICQKLGE